MSYVEPINGFTAPGKNGTLQAFGIEEPIKVWFGRYHAADEFARLCNHLWKTRPAADTVTVVICLHANDDVLNLKALLEPVGAAVRVVLTSARASTAAQWPLPWGDLRAEADTRRMKCLRIEPDADRAVIGAMQQLQAGDTFAVLASTDIEAKRITNWLTQGARWRGSLEAQDEDVFHHLAE